MYFIRKRIKIIVVLVSVLVIGVIGVVGVNYYNSEEHDDTRDNPIAFASIEETTTADVKHFYVDIKGSVNNPGVYFVSDGMIVNDVIELAGGLKKNAYTDNINLSLKLKNEMVIYVSNKSEMTPTTKTVLNDAKVVEESKMVDSTVKGLVNINTASIDELLTVSGIGKSKAEAIVAYRAKEKFKTIEDIKNVSGIGDALFEQIKNSITV